MLRLPTPMPWIIVSVSGNTVKVIKIWTHEKMLQLSKHLDSVVLPGMMQMDWQTVDPDQTALSIPESYGLPKPVLSVLTPYATSFRRRFWHITTM